MHTRTHVWEGAVDLQSLRSIACVLTKFRKPTELQSSMTTTKSWKYQMSMPLTGPRDWDWVGVSDSAGQADDLSDRAANCSAINYRFNTLPWKKGDLPYIAMTYDLLGVDSVLLCMNHPSFLSFWAWHSLTLHSSSCSRLRLHASLQMLM